jgi:hypothetical protein
MASYTFFEAKLERIKKTMMAMTIAATIPPAIAAIAPATEGVGHAVPKHEYTPLPEEVSHQLQPAEEHVDEVKNPGHVGHELDAFLQGISEVFIPVQKWHESLDCWHPTTSVYKLQLKSHVLLAFCPATLFMHNLV